MIRVLFVCLGNICRSPMAEAVFRDLIAKEGLSDKITVDSAGTGDWHIGSSPHEQVIKLLNDKNISCEGMTARQITSEDAQNFDYIMAMDTQNLIDVNKVIKELDGVVKIRFLDLLEDPPFYDVPDPYFTGNFDEVYDLIVMGCEALLKRIKQEKMIA